MHDVAQLRISPSENRLLAALDRPARERLFAALEPAELVLGEVLCEPGDVPAHAWFPVDAIISLLYVLEDGASTDVALAGNDGMIGAAFVTGGDAMPYRAVVQRGGFAFRVKAQRLKDELNRNRRTRELLLRYTQVLLTQIAQTAVCNRHHTVDQQLCRWLLESLDRSPSRTLDMTQELIATNLGVRREGVTAAARKLQQQDVIDYSRGHITVLDRARLETLCCECYDVVRRETERLLPSDAARL